MMTEQLRGSVARAEVAAELRRLRSTSGETAGQVAAALDWSTDKVQRIETGDVRISQSDLKALLRTLHVPARQARHLLTINRVAYHARGWWRAHNLAPTGVLRTVLELEDSADEIFGYANTRIPDVLRIPEYHTSVHDPDTDGDPVASLRLQRARAAHLADRTADGLRAVFVLDEALLHLRGITAESRQRQLAHLASLTDEPPKGTSSGLSVRVLPLTTQAPGLACAANGPFTRYVRRISAGASGTSVVVGEAFELPGRRASILPNHSRAVAACVRDASVITAASVSGRDARDLIRAHDAPDPAEPSTARRSRTPRRSL